MLFRLVREGEETAFRMLERRTAADLDLDEKDLENWIVRSPELIFGGEEVLVVAQSVRGRRMADILVLDAVGNLVIVEIKRDWSNRTTVGQSLEYAADMAGCDYERLEELHRDHCERQQPGQPFIRLIDQYRRLSENEAAEESQIPMGRRVCIVAPGSDEALRRIVDWLHGYGVPIFFVPFSLHAEAGADGEMLIEIEQLPKIAVGGGPDARAWRGDWFFNTNETHAAGAWTRMFEQGRIAIFGYANGPANLEGTSAGQRVFAYVNGRGILACGRVVDGSVFSDDSVFGRDLEYHLKVEWETIVGEDRGVTTGQVQDQFGQGLAVRHVFCGMYGDMPGWIAEQLRLRQNAGDAG